MELKYSLNFMLPYVMGCFFSIIVGHFIINMIVKALWLTIDKEAYKSNDKYLSVVQGIIERFLYTISFYIGMPEFIGIWIVLKAASQLKKWAEKPGYNVFLIGTGLSVIYGVSGGLIIRFLKEASFNSYVLATAIILGSFLLFGIIKIMQKFDKK